MGISWQGATGEECVCQGVIRSGVQGKIGHNKYDRLRLTEKLWTLVLFLRMQKCWSCTKLLGGGG